jgi:hypothetical protein
VAGRDTGDVMPLAAETTAVEPMAVTPEAKISLQATQTETGTLYDECGEGYATYTIAGDDVTGVFSGSITFYNYDDCSVVLDGRTDLSGKVNLDTGLPFNLKLTFYDLDATDGVGWDYTFAEGSVNFTFAQDLSGETATISLVLVDNTLGKSYWLKNCVIALTYLSETEDQATISGRFYDYDYGYVDISTLEPLRIPDTVRPTEGVLLFTGNASKARLTFYADQSTLLEVDDDNDGAFDDGSFINPLP